MPANALVTTRIDPHIKAEASLVLSAMGLTVSDAVRLMLTKIAKEHALPFDVWQPNAETIAAIEEARSKKLKSMSYDEFTEDMRAILNEED